MKTLLLLCTLFLAASALAQNVPVVMLSDVHFDPLRDPGKAARLTAAPITGWRAILEEPASPGQPESFAALQAACKAKGLDSDFALMEASLQQAHSQTAHPAFVTLSGDLLVHQIECRYAAATHSDKGFADFAEKTTSFVLQEVQRHFPGVPVYLGLGNNDSSCGDYRMSPHDRFFRGTADAVLHGLQGASPAELRRARASYQLAGYYSAAVPGLTKTRILAVDDIFLSKKYSTCADETDDHAGADAMLAWLDAQLADARAHGEHVWLLAHIPPSVDVYSTMRDLRDVCGGKKPEMFLHGTSLADAIARYPETVRLAVLGHTHADEIRLIGGVPVKLVGSVTPLHGNLPSVTIAQVSRTSAILQDYSVFVAPDKTGAGAWAQEYSFRQTYAKPDFSSASVAAVLAGFAADPDAADPRSKAYERNYFPGFSSPISLVWPQDVCSLSAFSAEAYRSCTCRSAAQ